MNLLALDTSTHTASVALMLGKSCTFRQQANPHSHSEFLLPMIHALLSEASISLQSLDGIVFGAGPGSFTGLRIACSVAKGLAFAHDLPLFPVCTLAALARSARNKMQDDQAGVLSLIDARMQALYWAYFEPGQVFSTAQLSAPAAIALPEGVSVVLAGVGIDPYYPLLSSALRSAVIQRESLLPHASCLLQLVVEEAVVPVNAAHAAPVYIRDQVIQGGCHG